MGSISSTAVGSVPGLHGADGTTFGSLVSGLAQMYPGAVAENVE